MNGRTEAMEIHGRTWKGHEKVMDMRIVDTRGVVY